MTAWQPVCDTEPSQHDSFKATLETSIQKDQHSVPALKPASLLVSQLREHCVLAVRWIQRKRAQQFGVRRMRVAETVSLGEKRSVSILQVDGAQFLIGSSSTNVQLLAVLPKQADAGDIK